MKCRENGSRAIIQASQLEIFDPEIPNLSLLK